LILCLSVVVGTAMDLTVSFSEILTMVPNDFVELYVGQNNAVATTIHFGNPYGTVLHVVKL
jgi:hypothetical protein